MSLIPPSPSLTIHGATPPEAPLAMPVQSLEKWNAADRRIPGPGELVERPIFARLIVFGGMMVVTLFGAWQMYQVVAVGTITLLEWALMALFVINLSWIAIAFTSSLVGFWWLIRRKRRLPIVPDELTTRTAVIMPIYNEAPGRVFSAMEAMIESVEATGRINAFEFFFLSDTTDPEVWIAEEQAFLALRARIGDRAAVWYRHRQHNVSRKAGNIEDWVSRWGAAYEHMLVLDADSLMTGEAIVTLARAMQADPGAGIIQTLPLVINRSTLFARVQQFAARVYGPVIAAGLALWMGRDGNYWGHNAIIRTKAFAAHAGMPKLSGKPPFGGLILSHDFVEAALIRRAGYSVTMYVEITGSYEESPPSLIDVATRDRRWCQGNLQHSRVISAAGLHWASRQHFATGIASYLASPLWLLQLFVGITLVLQAHYVRPEYFSSQFSLFPTWPLFDAERSLALFAGTMAILLAPKFLGLIVMLSDRAARRASGGALRLIASTLFEIVLSALLAPVMMLIQSGSVFEILMGRDSGWKPQRRDDGTIPWRDIVRRHRSHVALGLLSGFSAYVMSPYLFAWMSPTILGLVLAIPLSWASGSLAIGLWLKRRGLLWTPEEAAPPAIARRAAELAALRTHEDTLDALRVIHSDDSFRENHEAMLPPGSRSERGHFDPVKVMAQAKLLEARTLEDACRWLLPPERFTLLHDRALISLLARLPAAPIEKPARDQATFGLAAE